MNQILEDAVMRCVYFLACVLRPICVPVPEMAVVLWGTRQLKIPLPLFLKIGIIAKIISIGMIAFSGFLAVLQHFCKKGEAKLS